MRICVFTHEISRSCIYNSCVSGLTLYLLLVTREESEGKLKGILGYIEDDLVSADFVGDSR